MRTPTTLLLALFSLVAYSSAEAQRPAKPNVILMFVDDLGWQDVKCYDVDKPSPMETPNLDGLGKRGVQFWNGYSPAPTCAPSRCALLSGVHPARAQKTHVVGGAPPHPHHSVGSTVMAPWYSGRMPEDTFTIPRALKAEGYATGHTGKWHIAVEHHAFPQPMDVGFDFTTHRHGVNTRGAQSGMKNRLQDFATAAKDDPYRLDENGFPNDLVTNEAIKFIDDNKEKPVFLYYATWLVHTPIQTRSKALLEKYCKKLGVDYPTEPEGWTLEGQRNPYYCAMVEMLDYYVGQIISYLETTDDPRWPGHKLIENTYLVFTSDNGGMESGGKEIITDNYPLDKGKIDAKEGGVRVPFFIAGPGIAGGVQSDVVINALDLYPTILSWVGTEPKEGKVVDGSDLSDLLKTDPTKAELVKDAAGKTRDTMVWHFPHGPMQSTIRIGGYKLIRNLNHLFHPSIPQYELYELYDENGKRVDIEEANNLADKDLERAKQMDQRLTEILTEMNASMPYYNRHGRHVSQAFKKSAPTAVEHSKKGNEVCLRYKENGAAVSKAYVVYTNNPGVHEEEWFRIPATINEDSTVTVTLPADATHYYINLIDTNQVLVSYPECPDGRAHNEATSKALGKKAHKSSYTHFALSAKP
ncbi:MAG: sulfatase [Akkermansiaceae bacterium]